jgi:hypothetical protein
VPLQEEYDAEESLANTDRFDSLLCVALLERDTHSANAPAQTPTQTDPVFEKAVQPFSRTIVMPVTTMSG